SFLVGGRQNPVVREKSNQIFPVRCLTVFCLLPCTPILYRYVAILLKRQIRDFGPIESNWLTYNPIG
ncbi:MAG: hypothetical protein QXH91_07440, partial [Candidatus Bathyarchaeia archaeon]